MSEHQSAVERLADRWNATPDNSSTDYDCGRVDQRHDMTTQLLEAIEADCARAGVVAEEPEWEIEVTYSSKPGYTPSIDGYRVRRAMTAASIEQAQEFAARVDLPMIRRRTKAVPAGEWEQVAVKQEADDA